MLKLILLRLVLFFSSVWSQDKTNTTRTTRTTTTMRPTTAVGLFPLNLVFMLPFTRNGFPYIGGSVAQAIAIGLGDVQQEILPQFNLSNWYVIDTEHDSQIGIRKLADLYKEYRRKGMQIHGIIGPDSGELCFTVGFIAAAFSISEVSWGCDESTFSNRKMYPTFARTTLNADVVLPNLTAKLIKSIRMGNFATVLSLGSRQQESMSHGVIKNVKELMGENFKVTDFPTAPLDNRSDVPAVKTQLIYTLMTMRRSNYKGTIMNKCLLIFSHIFVSIVSIIYHISENFCPSSEDWSHYGHFCRIL